MKQCLSVPDKRRNHKTTGTRLTSCASRVGLWRDARHLATTDVEQWRARGLHWHSAGRAHFLSLVFNLAGRKLQRGCHIQAVPRQPVTAG